MQTVIIDGVTYVPATALDHIIPAVDLNGMPYQIVRTYSAGVFAGYVEKRKGKVVTMRNVRRIWYWDGAATLSQLAMEGTCKPENCKFAMPVNRIVLTEAIEILDCTAKAQQSIEEVKEWKVE
jgi:hypothetical protein